MRSRSARILATTVLAVAVAVVGASLTSATAGSPPETTIKPASLERGENPGTPQLLGKTILDGDLRIKVAAEEVQLLGASGDEYVVLLYPRNRSARVQRVAADGDRQTIMKNVDGDVALSIDGEQVFESVTRDGPRTVITVRDGATGDRQTRRTFMGYVRVLDASGGRAILGASSPSRTLWWNADSDNTRKISAREGYFADIQGNRFATLAGTTEDVCSVLSSLPPKAEVLWRSCKQAVLEAAPNGRRLVTTHIYLDGPIGSLQVRGDHGRLIATYGIDGSLGRSTFETNRAVLIQAYGARRSAIVRCVVVDCERASRRIDAP